MKKRYFFCLTGSILAWAFTGCFILSTINSNAVNFSETDDEIISEMKQQGLSSSSPYYLNEINTNAVRNFIRTYRNVTDPQWVKYSGGFVVSFRKENIHYKVYYDKTGDHQSTIRQYSEKELPFEIRHMIKSVYYDFSIYVINEVTTDGRTWYVINIEDTSSFKVIKIVDGVMEVMNEYIKSE